MTIQVGRPQNVDIYFGGYSLKYSMQPPVRRLLGTLPLTFRTPNVAKRMLPCDDAALRGVEPEAALDGGDDDVGEDHALHDGRQAQARQQPTRAQPQGRPPVGLLRENGWWLR